ncbi:hypothetical protein ASF27_20985 [Methylobacterium sp. Leaf102]|uniref:hypothetical protein n=1 Tax=Methylobacterium sp. Leaf102 TaxID=1736253 RepID=UPI0007006664|nr:hypothetical protein [Methylobacterium sp. Leaf102]KQP27458.1 hypothetical protein ASF27_20985 [Methylobacterium sp. Leaf102]
MAARVTIYLPTDVHKAVQVAALDQDIFVSDFMTKAARAYLASGGNTRSALQNEAARILGRKIEESTRTIMDLLRKAGPEGIKHSVLGDASVKAGNILGATDAALRVLTEAGVVRKQGQRLMLTRPDEHGGSKA